MSENHELIETLWIKSQNYFILAFCSLSSPVAFFLLLQWTHWRASNCQLLIYDFQGPLTPKFSVSSSSSSSCQVYYLICFLVEQGNKKKMSSSAQNPQWLTDPRSAESGPRAGQGARATQQTYGPRRAGRPAGRIELEYHWI